MDDPAHRGNESIEPYDKEKESFMNIEKMNRLKQNPRSDFIQAIQNRDIAQCLVKTAEIHGHFCPGSAFGVMASLWGLELLGLEKTSSRGMENLMAIVETNACFADGVQAVSGCTLGNNALVYRDLGRLAVAFALRNRETGVRVRIKGELRSHVDQVLPDFFPLLEKVIKDRTGTPEDEAEFRNKGREAAFALIRLPFETLFVAEESVPALPPYAPISPSIVCPGCGETVMATKVVNHGEKKGICFMCADNGYYEVEGRGIVKNSG